MLGSCHFRALGLSVTFLRPFAGRDHVVLASVIHVTGRLNVRALTRKMRAGRRTSFLQSVNYRGLRNCCFKGPLPLRRYLPFYRSQSLSFRSLRRTILLGQTKLVSIDRSSPMTVMTSSSRGIRFLRVGSTCLGSLRDVKAGGIASDGLFLHSHGFPVRRGFHRFTSGTQGDNRARAVACISGDRCVQIGLGAMTQTNRHYVRQTRLCGVDLSRTTQSGRSHHLSGILQGVVLACRNV